MKLLILGGTGGTGKQVVFQALEAGHDVTVLARDRAKVGPDRPQLHVIVGDLQNGVALAEAIRGQDAVISVIGRGYSFKSEHLIERTVPGIIGAMEAAGVGTDGPLTRTYRSGERLALSGRPHISRADVAHFL